MIQPTLPFPKRMDDRDRNSETTSSNLFLRQKISNQQNYCKGKLYHLRLMRTPTKKLCYIINLVLLKNASEIPFPLKVCALPKKYSTNLILQPKVITIVFKIFL